MKPTPSLWMIILVLALLVSTCFHGTQLVVRVSCKKVILYLTLELKTVVVVLDNATQDFASANFP